MYCRFIHCSPMAESHSRRQTPSCGHKPRRQCKAKHPAVDTKPRRQCKAKHPAVDTKLRIATVEIRPKNTKLKFVWERMSSGPKHIMYTVSNSKTVLRERTGDLIKSCMYNYVHVYVHTGTSSCNDCVFSV